MRAIIPVAGLGSRLKPHTHTIPKVLLNVGGKPILGHILDKLIEENIFKATFIYGHLGELIKTYVNENYKSIDAVFIEQEKLEGLGHAIYTAIPTFDEEELFIILGDTVFDVDLKNVFHEKISSLGIKRVDDPSRFGVAIMNNGRIEKLIEKPKDKVSDLALVGLYYITNSNALIKSLTTLVEKNIRTRGELQLTDALQLMIEDGEVMKTFNVDGWYDCGKPETLLSTNQFLLTLKANKTTKDFPSVVIIPPVFISESAIVENSVIGPFTTISDDAKVYNAVIRNSIIGTSAEVARTMLENSIIGNNSIIKGNYKKLNTGDSSEIDFY
ncbi:MAG: nucleotidyl transferase [Chlorobiaceae bacterium]|mgnify:CR=1 FL=1|nr:nucleotidyl transferase [Chlorobiaceae bacterium]MBA4309807.1 nucleotidyl transferase [Chlorobiaceae bacterium]